MTCRTIAALYELAAREPAQRAEPAAALRVVAQAVEQTWDRERFADDPRKHQPVFPFDRKEHLIVKLHDVLASAGVPDEQGVQRDQAPHPTTARNSVGGTAS
ncbi:MAG: hypothetical protein WD534_08655 [Phycisphaeraceae bacterium]